MGTRRHGCSVNHSSRILFVESRQIQESRNTVHVERKQLIWTARKADSDDGGSGEMLIVLPRGERKAGEQLVLAENDVRSCVPCSVDRAVDPYDAFGHKSELPEIPANVLGNKLVTPHAESAERRVWMAHENIVDRSTNHDKS